MTWKIPRALAGAIVFATVALAACEPQKPEITRYEYLQNIQSRDAVLVKLVSELQALQARVEKAHPTPKGKKKK